MALTALLALAAAPASAATRLEQEILAAAPGLRPQALRAGLRAFEQVHERGLVRRPVLTLIDYGLPSTKRRLWVLDLEAARVVHHEWVAHGRGSGELFARRFSNQPGSAMSSLGSFLTGRTYRGRHGYSMRLHGLDPGANDRAEERAIVVHAAGYVDTRFAARWGRLGRSLGCPALRPAVAASVIDSIKGGTLLFAFHE